MWQARRELITERAREIRMTRRAAKQRANGVEAGLSAVLMAAVPAGPVIAGSHSCVSNPPWSEISRDVRQTRTTNRLEMEKTMTAPTTDPFENYKAFRDKLLKDEAEEFRTKLVVAVLLFSSFWLLGGVVCQWGLSTLKEVLTAWTDSKWFGCTWTSSVKVTESKYQFTIPPQPFHIVTTCSNTDSVG